MSKEDKSTGVSLIDSVVSVTHWSQGFSWWAKIPISVGLVLFALGALYLLWQEPPKSSDPTSSQNEEAKNSAPISSTISHSSIASTGQSGGVTAGTYINQAPPVTEQQKQQAIDSLSAEVSELAEFPQRSNHLSPPTFLQQMAVARFPYDLYVISNKYYRGTIAAVPTYGKELMAFKSSYYDFEVNEGQRENQLLEVIGSDTNDVGSRIRDAWTYYLRYFIVRYAGMPIDQVQKTGFMLNYGISWENLENCFQHVKDTPEGIALGQGIRSMEALQESAQAVLNKAKS